MIKKLISDMLVYSNTQYNLRVKKNHKTTFLTVIKLWLCVEYLFMRLFSSCKPHLPYLEIVVTNRCNMRCAKCANLIPFIEHPCDIPIKQLMADTNALLDRVSCIDVVKLLGGEAFLYKELPQMIGLLASSPKVKYLEIVINGRILPTNELLSAIKNNPLVITVSPYGENERVIELFNKERINYHFVHMESWTDFGGFDRRNRHALENRKMFKKCPKCVTLIDGRIYYCPRSGNGSKTELVPFIENESVNVRDNDKISTDLKRWKSIKCISTCDYCDLDGPAIPIAQQVNRDE